MWGWIKGNNGRPPERGGRARQQSRGHRGDGNPHWGVGTRRGSEEEEHASGGGRRKRQNAGPNDHLMKAMT